MELLLLRNYHDKGTNGVLLYRNHFICYTIELPWKDNRKKTSCIPEGQYRISVRNNERLGAHLKLQHVPGRNMILVHTAHNALKELQGCIAPVSGLTGHGRGIGSRDAFRRVKNLLQPSIKNHIPVYLTIKSLVYERNTQPG